jgi:hypothetical protein
MMQKAEHRDKHGQKERLMRIMFVSFVLSLTTMAYGQSNEDAWLVDEQVALRFPEGETQGPRFEAGAKVVVVYREGTRIRVKGDAGFGWVAEDAITTEKPTMSNVDLEAMMERIKAMNLGDGGATSQPFSVGGGQ